MDLSKLDASYDEEHQTSLAIGRIFGEDEDDGVPVQTWTRNGVPIGENEEPQAGDIDEDGWEFVCTVQCTDKRSLIEKTLNPENKPVGKLNRVTIFPGDKIVINGATVVADRTVTLSSYAPSFNRVPAPGMTDLPETDLRIHTEFSGPRVPMENITDLRCPCGSAYTRKSETHHSCLHCKRVWTNDEVDTIRSFEGFSPF